MRKLRLRRCRTRADHGLARSRSSTGDREADHGTRAAAGAVIRLKVSEAIPEVSPVARFLDVWPIKDVIGRRVRLASYSKRLLCKGLSLYNSRVDSGQSSASTEIAMGTSYAITQPHFAGHETFPLRYGWLKKAVDGIANDPELFTRDDALVTLGVGKNMVRAIRHWALSTGVLYEDPDVPNNRGRQLRLTTLGKLLFGHRGLDPFLEEPGSLWLLHWQLCSSPDSPTTWHWTFNHFADAEFTKERLLRALQGIVDTNEWNRVAPSTLRRDVDCFIRTYTPTKTTRLVVLEDTLDCPFVELQLLHDVEGGHVYSFARGDHPTLPTWVVLFAILHFWQSYAPNRDTLNFDDVAYRPGSPGQVFKLSEDGLTRHLEALEAATSRALGYDVTAGLRQIYRRKSLSSEEVIERQIAARRERKQG